MFSSNFFCQTQEVDSVFHPKQKIGLGVSNIGEIVHVSLNDSNPFPKTIRYVAEYHHEIDTNLFVRFGTSSAISSLKNGNLREYYFVPLNFNLGLEKIISKKKLDIIYGADLFYTLSLRGGNQFGSGMWQGDDYGFGIAPMIGLDYQINNDWIIGTEFEIGFGLHREFTAAGNVTRQILKPGIIQPRMLSISLKYLLWNS